MLRMQTFLGLILAVMLATACSSNPSNLFAKSGAQPERILLWHTWSPQQATALDAMLDAYEQFNPAVEVISIAIPEAQLATRLATCSQSGFGPDLLLTDAAILYSLSRDGLIRNLAPLNLELSYYLTSAVRMLSDDGHLYGLPMSVHTHVLYFNRTLVDTPPATIAELVERVEQGEALGQSPRFLDSYWGVGAFDGGIADSERRILLGSGGFSNWLDFLVQARTLPGFVLDVDPVALRQAFIDGDITYYIGDSDQYLELAAAMEPDAVGVAPLPLGPNGGAPRPFLQLDALAFGTVSSRQEFREALNLAHFLTDVPNQLALATEDLGIAPANSQIRLTPSLPDNSLVVARQGRSAEAVSWINRAIWSELSEGALGFLMRTNR